MAKLPGNDDVRSSRNAWDATVTFDAAEPEPIQDEPMPAPPPVQSGPSDDDLMNELRALGGDNPTSFSIPNLFDGQSATDSPAFDALSKDGTLDKIVRDADVSKKADDQRAVADSADGTNVGVMGRSWGMLSPAESKDWLTGELKDARHASAIAEQTRTQTQQAIDTFRKIAPGKPLPPWLAEQEAFQKEVEKDRGKRLQTAYDMEAGKIPMAQKGVIRSGSEQLVQGVSGIISGMVKSAGIAAGFAGKVSGVDIGPDDNMTYRFGQWIEDKTRELFPGDVARQAEFGQKLAQGAGSMIGFYGPGIIGKIMGASNAKLVALTATTGALAEGSSTFDEALLSQKQGREVSDMAKFLAWGGGLLLGTTEALPVASLIKGGRGSLVTAMLSQMIEEGGQEGLQTFGENVLAKVLHDPDRNLSDNVMENLAIGGLLGGFITGGSFAVSRKMREAERAAGAAEQAQVGLQVEEPKDAQPVQPIIPPKPAKAARQSADIGDQPIASTPIQTPASVENEVVTPDGSLALPVETVLVEFEDLVHATGDLQPRDRSLKESAEQTRYVAANLDPSRLMPQRVSDVGAPVIAPDGTILSGNMRTMALGQVYSDPQLAARAQAYRAFLPPEAANMKAPVLVRRIKGDVTPEQLVTFADKSNRPAIAQMGATERAARDARAAGGDVMRLYTGGDFTRVENRPFLRAFVNAAVSPTERGAMAREGLLTKEGEDRLTNAVLAATYAKPELLARMLESTDDNIRAISGAMRDAAGIILGLKQSVENGETAPEFDITPQIAEAALRIAMWRQKGIKPADALAQQDAFTQIDPTVEAIVRAFYNEDLTRPVSRKAMTEFLVYYANEAKLHSGQQGLIPDETSPQDVLELSRDRVIRGDVARDTADLFAQGEGLGRGDLAGDGQIAVEPGPDGGGLALGQEAGDVGTEEFSAKFVPGKQAGKKDRKAAVDQGQQDFFAEVFASAVDELSSITTDEQRAAFRAVLAGTSPRKDWAGLVGATSPQIEALEQEAIRDGLLRQTKSGQVRRTAKAKDVGPRTYTVDDVRNGIVVRSQEMTPEAWSKLKMDLKMQQPFETVEQMLEVAAVAQARLGEVGRTISEKTGATFRFPKIKGRERIEEKLSGRDPRNLTDVTRAGFDADTLAQADELIAELAKSFGVVDEGWAVIADSGYFDRKSMIYHMNRIIGEIQIWPPGMFEAKEIKGGHALYEISRSPKASPQEKADALVKQRELYAKTISEMPLEFQDFADELRRSSAAPMSAAGNIAASSERVTSGQSRASAPMTGPEGPINQPLPGAIGSTPAAFSPETTVGPSRNTKYPNFRSISSPPSTSNIASNQQNFNLSIPSDERLVRVISLREEQTGTAVNGIVSDYAYRIEEARSQGVAAVEALIAEIAADKVMRKADALELAHLVGYPPKKSTTKKAALQSIVQRATDFSSGQQVADLFAQEGSNVSNGFQSVERTGGNSASANGLGEAGAAVAAGSDVSGVEQGRESPVERGGFPSRAGLPADNAASMGTVGYLPIQEGAPGPGFGGSAAERGDSGRGSDAGVEGDPAHKIPAKTVGKDAVQPARVKSDAEKQAEADLIPVVPADLENIAATLPTVIEANQRDIFTAERAFESGKNGFLFTNGTGTGKTFLGAGFIKRQVAQGRGNILILAPSQGILDGWIKTGEILNLKINRLDSTKTAGEGVVATTYANLEENATLATRDWDYVIADEAHSLSQNKSGNPTTSLQAFRSVTNKNVYGRANLLMQERIAALKITETAINDLKAQGKYDDAAALHQQYRDAYVEYLRDNDDLKAELETRPQAKVMFLSATPFAYRKSVDYAEGFLFDYPADSNRYGTPGGRDAFLVENFGYGFRYNRAEEPGPEVNTAVLEREFHEKLKKQGVLAGRRLEIDQDYDRRFVLVDDAVGANIDLALEWLAQNRDMYHLREYFGERFDYLKRRRLLEALKAKHLIGRIKTDLKLGRKIVVFHDYIEGGGFDPFFMDPEHRAVTFTMYDTTDKGTTYKVTLGLLYDQFIAANPFVTKMNWAGLGAPIDTLTKAFPKALVYNGRVPNKKRKEARDLFNQDGSGRDIIIVQSDAGAAGISLHDTTGRHQRILYNLGLPVRPTYAIQQEGRIYRQGQASDAILRYMSTGTSWERWAFAQTIAERASTAENLALGNEARRLRESFINAFNDATEVLQSTDEGKGGKSYDRADGAPETTDYERAKALYYTTLKNRNKRDQREGKDYYATPEPLGLKMVQFADIKSGEDILEPSAGHGAISRWFLESSNRTIVEPSSALASQAALNSPGAKMVNEVFEDLNIVNKFDAITMNPPFGSGGSTAFAHLQKATQHLRNGGRIVAILPRGGKADQRYEAFQEDEANSNIYIAAELDMPGVMFDRAGTKVNTRLVVLERLDNPEDAPNHVLRRDYSNVETVADLFDIMQDLGMRERNRNPQAAPRKIREPVQSPSVPERQMVGSGSARAPLPPRVSELPQGAIAPETTQAEFEKLSPGMRREIERQFLRQESERVGRVNAPQPQQALQTTKPRENAVIFKTGETTHSRTGDDLFVASIAQFVQRNIYDTLRSIAKKYDGYYSTFRGRGAIPGFQFKSEDDRANFLSEATNISMVTGKPFEGERQNSSETYQNIQAAYLQATGGRFNARGLLSDVRAALPGMSREDLDKALRQMQTDGLAILYPMDAKFENGVLVRTPEVEAAAIDIGGPKHILWIEHPIHDEQGMGALTMDAGDAKARAEAAGFNTSFVAYRGLWDQYDTEYAQYADMQMFSRDKEVARGYGDVIVQAYLRLGKNLEIFAFGSDWDRIKKDALPTDVVEELGLRDGDLSVRAIALAAKRVGYDSLTVHDVYDHDSGIREAPTTVDVVFKAKDVRSTKAAFNPAQDESANLYAAMTTGMRDSFPEWTEAVVSEARKLLPADVALRIKDRIQAGGFNFDARYLPISKALEIAATNGPKRALALARHEAIHVARSMNLFTAEEWALLLERAEKLNIDDQITTVDQKTGKQIPAIPVYREMYAKQAGLNALSGADADAYVSERINQERVAKMAELWEGGAQYGAKVDTLIDRIVRLFEAMVNAVRGLGFQSVGDVADSFLAGDVARRKRIEPTFGGRYSQTDAGKAVLDGFGLGGLRLTDQDRLGYFSGALRAAYNLRQAKGTPEQMLAMLQKEGAKKAEIEATGLGKFILGRETDTGAAGDGRPSATGAASSEGRTAGQRAANVSRNQVTKQEIIDYLEQNRVQVREVQRNTVTHDPATGEPLDAEDFDELGRPYGVEDAPKWSPYSLDPNNPTYRETVLHLPETPIKKFSVVEHPEHAGNFTLVDERGEYVSGRMADGIVRPVTLGTDRASAERAAVSRNSHTWPTQDFRSGHFPEPNIVGHMMTSMVKHEGKATYLIDQIQSDWGQKLRDGGVRDEAKIAELKKRISKIGPSPAWLSDNGANDSTSLKAEIASMFKSGLLRRSGLTDGEERALGIIFARSDGQDGINGGINEIHQKSLVGSSDLDTLLTKIKNRPDVEKRMLEIDAEIKAGANRRLLMAELRTAEAATPGHPLVNTTDQWTTTTLRRAIRQAVEADAEYIAIPHGDTVLSYNPGQEGMLGFYGSRTEEGIVPKNLRKLLQNMDRNTPPPQRVEKLETSQGAQGWNSEEKYPFDKGNTGFTIVKLTDKVKKSVIDEGQALFALTAYHGSPSDFTSFDWQKMRSGGGHTDVVTPGLHYYAFGHHFGSDKRVAGEYQRVVARKLFNGKPFDLNSPAHVAANAIANMNGDRAAAIADLEERASYHEAQAGSRLLRAFGGGSSAAVQDAVVSRKAADILRANREASRSLSGGLYEVSLDLDESDVLDFGKTLSSHGTKIRTAALAFVKDALPRLQAQMETRDLSADEFDVLSSLVRIAKDEPETLTGADVVTLAGGPREDASLAMKAAGIRAIKYRDQYSRDAVGSFNYVVFDDSIISIKSKDGKPVSDAERAGVMGSMASEAMGALRAPDPKQARPFGPSGDVTVRTKPDGTRVRTYKDGASFAAISETSDGTWAVQMADGPEAAGILQRIEQDIGQRLAPDGWLSPESYSYWQAAKPQALRSHVNAGPLFGNMWVPVSAIDPAINVLGEVVTRGADTDRRAKAARQIQQLRAIKMQAAPSVADEVLPALQGLPSPINLGSAYQGTGESTERLDVSLSNLVAKVNTSLGLITRMGRLNPGLKAMASRRGGSIGGQYSKKTGVTRLAIPNDIVTLAHEGGHAIENRYDTKAAVAGLKAKFAEDLILPPAPDVPAPQMPSTGFSGIEIDAETQAVLIEAVQKKARLKQMGATVGMAKQGRGPGYDARLYAQLQEEAGSAREILKRRLGQQITDAVMADLDASGAQDFAAYTAQRFAETGQPQPRLQLAFTATQLSEAWGDWFAQYVTAPDLARTISPGLYAAFETEMDGIDPGMLEGLEAVQDGYQRLLASSPVEALRSRVQTTVRPGKIGALRDQIAKDGVANTITNWVYSFYSAVIDGKHPMKVAVKYLLKTYTQNTGLKLGDDERLVLKAIDDPYKRWRLAEHSKVQATNILQNGVRLKGQDINQGVSYHDALKHAFGGTWSSQWNEEKAELFGSYLIARRMLFEFTRFDAGALEREPDLLMQRDVWRQSKDRIETTNPEFAQAADILYEFNRNLLQWKFEEGFIDPQTYQDLLQRDDYVPLNRIMDDEDGPITLTTPRGANKRKMLQRFKGSTRDFINPLESIAQDVYATQARVALNGVIRAMDKLAIAAGPGGGAIAERLPAKEIKGTKVNLREVLRSAAKTEGLATDDTEALMELIDDLFDQEASGNIFRATDINEKGERIVYLWEGGKRVPVRLGDDRIGKDIFDQMVAFGTNNANLAVDVATGFTQVLRAGVTKAPAYILTNLFRDQFATWVLSSAYTPFVSATKGMKDTVSSGEAAIRYQAAAGMMGGVDTHLMNTAARGHDVLTLRKKGFWAVPGGTVVGRTWNGFLRTMEITEAATRVGHFDALYKRALADGMTPEEALFEAGYMAHDVMDFSRRGGGPGMQSLTRMVAFLNASVQALDAARRTMTGERNLDTAYRRIATPYIKAVNGSPLSVAERQQLPESARMWLKMASIMMIGVALAAYYRDDDEYEELSDYMRSTHWFFKLNGTWYRYPKPFELATLSNAGEAAFEAYWKQDPRALTQFLHGLQHTMVPPHEIQAAKFIYELKSGKDMFRDRDIIGMDIAKLPPELQYNAYTSELGKMIGAVTGTSPAMVDHFMATGGATIARDVMSATDYLLPRMNQAVGGKIPGVSVTPRAEKSVEDYWFVSRFTRRMARGALSTEYFWNQMSPTSGEYAQAAAGYKRLYEAGRVDPRKSIEAKALLDNLTDDQKAYAMLETYFSEKEQDLNPLNRARQVMSAASGIRKEMLMGAITLQESKKKNREIEAISLTPTQQRSVNEILEDYAMREARNALIVTGIEGWAQKSEMATAGLIEELRRVHEGVADEFEARVTSGRNKVYPYEAIKRLWPEARKRLLEDGQDAVLNDLAAEARSY